MQFSKPQIAALVLGYLKSEKLISVVEEFTKCCTLFEENNVKMGKYFITRVNGMKLVDFLEEYGMIYRIVQSRLEETNYFETYSRTTLVEQLLYLLEKEQSNSRTSSPVPSVSCEVDATPAHTLPGNSCSLESETSLTKTPKRRTRNRSQDEEEVIDMTEVLTQSLLEHHELHEKIAETINIVRNTPEVTKVVSDEHISAGASKELDAVIKTVIQRTEEDPVYNKFLNEIIGTAPAEHQPPKRPSCNTPPIEETPKSRLPDEDPKNRNHSDPMDDHNNDAIRSIIEAAQNTDPPPPNNYPETSTPAKNDPGGEVILFDGNLDTYLKSSGAATLNPNPVYLNTGGLIVVPPPEPPKQFYIVNNQPMFKMNVPTVLTEKDLMSIPTIIVNDEPSQSLSKKNVKKKKVLKPKVSENLTVLNTEVTTRKGVKKTKTTIDTISTIGETSTTVVTASVIAPSVTVSESTSTPSTRQASHVRNLDFSTPNCRKEEKIKPKKSSKAWDSDLRQLVYGPKDKLPSPKKKRPSKKKKSEEIEDEDSPEEEKIEEVAVQTPVKDSVPKTPGGVLPPNSVHCTPFTEVLEEHLKGVDLSSIPTPSIPITPGFALTPGDMVPYNQRSTDYSTSSSYYQPSDTEQGKTINQLIEECREFENKSPTQEKVPSLKILSDVVIEKAKLTVEVKNEGRRNCSDHLKKFNNNVIGKKNLSLINRVPTTSSSSSESEEENAKTEETNKTIIRKKESKNNVSKIKNIIRTIEVREIFDEDKKKKNLLSQLEEKRLRTINKIKNDGVKKTKTIRKPAKPKTPKAVKKRSVVRKKVEENVEEQDLVKGLAQRGIHLIPNKPPQSEKVEEISQIEETLVFDRKTYEDCEVAIYDDKNEKKTQKKYDFTVLKKSMSAAVFFEDLHEEVVRTMKWTECFVIFEKECEDELMDYALVGSVREESPEIKPVKGGKKRKSRFSDDDGKQNEKRNKTYEELLKKIDVDDFLNKVHGE